MFVVSIITAFPFSQDAPLTVFFQQRVALDFTNTTNLIRRAVTIVSGVPDYIEDAVVLQLPSSWGSNVECIPDSRRVGLSLCMWEADLFPSPGGTSNHLSAPQPWVQLTTKCITPSSALLRPTHAPARCSSIAENLTRFDVYEGDDGDGSLRPSGMGLQPGYDIPARGFSSIAMSSWTWDKEFTVEVGWDDDAAAGGEELRGRVACE